ncbi:transposase, partial [Weizmannia coagulans]
KENVVYNYKGTVSCVCPETGKQREMCNGGFEKDRQKLKKLCPAKQMGVTCEGKAQCPVAQGLRISLSEDRRIFTPIDRSSYKWKKEYNRRTAVERVNSRLDTSFGFELHTIRGMAKMKLRCGLALCVMLAMALGRIKENQAEKMRSLVS